MIGKNHENTWIERSEMQRQENNEILFLPKSLSSENILTADTINKQNQSDARTKNGVRTADLNSEYSNHTTVMQSLAVRFLCH